MTKLYDVARWPKLGLEPTDYPFIGAVDATLALRRIIDVSGQKFSVIILNHSENTAGVLCVDTRIERAPDPIELEKNVICPYCGYVYRDCFEFDDDDTTECQSCGGTIHYQRIVNVRYTTEPVKAPRLIRAHWV